MGSIAFRLFACFDIHGIRKTLLPITCRSRWLSFSLPQNYSSFDKIIITRVKSVEWSSFSKSKLTIVLLWAIYDCVKYAMKYYNGESPFKMHGTDFGCHILVFKLNMTALPQLPINSNFKDVCWIVDIRVTRGSIFISNFRFEDSGGRHRRTWYEWKEISRNQHSYESDQTQIRYSTDQSRRLK